MTDKIYAMNNQPAVDAITRQSKQGRSSGGALKLGTMERDALLTHGLSAFTKECFMEKSDKEVFISKKEDIKYEAPYCFDLVQKEFQAIGIKIEEKF